MRQARQSSGQSCWFDDVSTTVASNREIAKMRHQSVKRRQALLESNLPRNSRLEPPSQPQAFASEKSPIFF
jgi:hypothetical protein